MKVAIVGAGASGLASAAEFKARNHEVEVFEQNTRLGGVWAYSPEVERDPLGQDQQHRVYSSLYQNLRTNLPVDLMAFKGFPLTSFVGGEASWPRFPHHSCIYEYLQRYARARALEEHIRFETPVTSIKPVANHWQVETNKGQDLFDAVVVCSGHFSEPRIPELSGLATFSGRTLHSHNYRNPDEFAGLSVAVLGCGASGADIAQELLPVTENLYWCGFEQSRRAGRLNLLPFPDAIDPKGFSVAEQNYEVDVLLLCTGYRYELPFVPSDIVTIDDNFVAPLYRDIVAPGFPSLGFVGLPFLVVPFPLYAMQAKWFAAQLDGEFALPPEKAMLDHHQRRVQALREAGVKQRHFHRLGPEQEVYYNQLADECGAQRLPDWFSELATEAQRVRNENPANFRDVPLKYPRQIHL